MNITILMSVWCQNIWDELILKNEILFLRRKYWENTTFSVFTYDLDDIFFQENYVKYFEYFPIWIRNPRNIFRNIKNFLNFLNVILNSDKVVIGWWWIFFDNEKWNYSNPLKQWFFRSFVANVFKKEIIIYWVSIDVKSEKSINIVKSIFSKANEIFVRDENSKKFLDEIWINSEIILDPVFSDNWEKWIENFNKNFLLKKINASDFSFEDLSDINFEWKNVWIAFRCHYLNDEKNNILKTIDYILSKWWKILLLPHSFHKIDKVANDYEFLKEFVKNWVEISKNMQETYSAYNDKKIDFCLSMRLHSMILSQVYAIPFIAIKYAKKSDLM